MDDTIIMLRERNETLRDERSIMRVHIDVLKKETAELKNQIIDLGAERTGEKVVEEWGESKLGRIAALEKDLERAKTNVYPSILLSGMYIHPGKLLQ